MFSDDPTKLSAKHVVQAAETGDAVAIRIIESAGDYVGIGLAAVASAFDPEVIVVGGSVVLSGSILLQRAQRSFRERTISPLGSLIPIVPAALGEESSLWGAASLPTSMKG
jgi:glucokinase